VAEDDKDKVDEVEGEGLENEDAPKEDPDAPEADASAEEKPKPKRKRAPAKKKAAAADADAEAEEKPKPKRKAKPKPKPKAEDEEPAEEPEAKDDSDDEEEPAEEAKPKRRRGAAEVTASERNKPGRARTASANGEPVIVRAKARYVRTAPRKARLVIDHIRGKPVEDARALLLTTPRAASRDVLKLLDSAIANAENNHELVADELVVGHAYVDEGPTLKRYRPRALGRATRIRKRTSHMTITLTTNEGNGS